MTSSSRDIRRRILVSAFVEMLTHYTLIVCVAVVGFIYFGRQPLSLTNWETIFGFTILTLSLISGPITFFFKTPRGERRRIIPWLRAFRACALVVAIPYVLVFNWPFVRPWMTLYSAIRELFLTLAAIALFWLPDLIAQMAGRWRRDRRLVVRQSYSPVIAYGVAAILFLALLLISSFLLDFAVSILLNNRSWIQRLRWREEITLSVFIAICVVIAYGGARLVFMRIKWRSVPLDYPFCVTCGYDLRGIVGRCPECGTVTHCGTCGYNLTANTTGTCPECGTPISTT